MALLYSEIFGLPIADFKPGFFGLSLSSGERAVSSFFCGRESESLLSDRLGFRLCSKRVWRQEAWNVCCCTVLLRTVAWWGGERKRLYFFDVSRAGVGVVCHSALPLGEEIVEKERLRREKISLGNRGKIPWNKGRNHPPETIARIRQRNLMLLEDPKFREKLRQRTHAPHSEETKEKIRKSMKATLEARSIKLRCVVEWRESIAETARIGGLGEEKLQWDSRVILRKALIDKYKEREQEKKRGQRKPYKRIWTLEQRTKMSDLIKAKWDDPIYRQKVVTGVYEFYKRREAQVKKTVNQEPVLVENENSFLSVGKSVALIDNMSAGARSQSFTNKYSINKIGSYVDPMSEEKLQRIKQLRAQKLKEKGGFLLEIRKAGQTQTEVANQAKVIDSTGACVENGGTTARTDSEAVKPEVVEQICKPCEDASRQDAGEQADYNFSEVLWHKVVEQAQIKARERARMLMSEAERATIAAAKALEAVGTIDVGAKYSLIKARNLLDEAGRSIGSLESVGYHNEL